MPLIILLIVLILIFGGGGYYMGPGLGYYGGGGLSLILALILIYLIFGRAAHGSSSVGLILSGRARLQICASIRRLVYATERVTS